MEFFLKEDDPVRWKGPTDLSPVWLGVMEMSVIREFLADVIWGDLDLLLVDLPPGAAADKPPAIVGFISDLDGAVVVTTPSDVAIDVVRKSILYARDVGIRVLGLVVNMAGVICSECRHENELFDGQGEELCRDLNILLLGRIPFDRQIGRACDQGSPLLEDSIPPVRRFTEIAHSISKQIL
jgi:ATP-binding protein involved in chromosome partitioning